MEWMPWGQKMSLQDSCMWVFLVWRLMMGPGDACKTHDGARGCMQDPPAKLGTLLRCSCKGLGLHAIQGGLCYMYTCTWTSITSDMNIRHEHRLPQTWASYTHTSDMNIEHQTWTSNIRHEHEHQTCTSNIRHEHRTSNIDIACTSDMNIEHQTWTSNIRQMCMHECVEQCRFMYAGCMHTYECMHACTTMSACTPMGEVDIAHACTLMHSDPMN